MAVNKAFLSLIVLALAACAKSPSSGIAIEDAWSPAAPPGAPALAVYAQIVPAQDDTLLGVSSTAAANAELHATLEQDGVMQMRPVGPLPITARTTVTLEPGGMHLMLMGPREPVAAGGTIPVVFHFAKAGDVTVNAEVRAPGNAHAGH